MTVDSFFVALGLIVAVIGFIGCIMPAIPGPPLSYASLLMLSLVRDWEPFGLSFLLVMGLLTVVVSALDYIIPAAGARKYGSSKFGVWGSIIGMLLGMIFFSFFGLVLGGLAGAIVGELYAGKTGHAALRAGWGVLIGNVTAILFKMLLSGIMLFYYVKAVF